MLRDGGAADREVAGDASGLGGPPAQPVEDPSADGIGDGVEDGGAQIRNHMVTILTEKNGSSGHAPGLSSRPDPFREESAIVRSRPISDAAQGRWVLSATILGSTMAILDSTVVNVALPVIQRKLSASLAEAQWVVEAYLLFLSSLIMIGGSLGDRIGRRRVFAAGATVFAIASAACGAAGTIGTLVIARAVQGIGAALLVPGSLSLITANFPAGRRGPAIGTWSGATALAGALGPLAGGFLVDRLSWRAVFYLNLPLAAAVVAIALLRVPESRDRDSRPPDLPGAILAVVFLGGIVTGLIEASRGDFARLAVAIPTLAGIGAGAVFLAVEARSDHPMVPIALFRSRTFVAANLVTLFLYGAMGAAFFFLPFNLIRARGYSPTAAGAALLPAILLIAVLSRFTGRFGERVGPRLPLTLGPVLVAAGFALFLRIGPAASYATTYLLPVVLFGLGMAVAVAPLTTTVMESEADRYAGIVSGFNNAVARVAGLLAIAFFGIVASAADPGSRGSPGSDASVRAVMAGCAAAALASAATAALLFRKTPSSRAA